jgi:hypothetical protein
MNMSLFIDEFDSSSSLPYATGELWQDDFAMADFRLNPGNGKDLGSLTITFSQHARANLEQRAISQFQVMKALREGDVVSVDGNHYVVKFDDGQGGFRVMVDKTGDSLIVRTAVRTDELTR